jgi:hypothetical protein
MTQPLIERLLRGNRHSMIVGRFKAVESSQMPPALQSSTARKEFNHGSCKKIVRKGQK